MAQGSYRQFCPVAIAADFLSTRWTIVLLRELLAGSTRFNDLRRGVPRMSPALLSQRLKDLQAAGVVAKVTSASGSAEYHLTEAGRELGPIVDAFGIWGQRRVKAEVSLEHLDVQLLMWDMHRGLNTTPMPGRRVVIQFIYSDLPANRRNAWLVVHPETGVDLCAADPGFDVDLYVSTDLRTMTAIWMGHEAVRRSIDGGRMLLTGDEKLAADMQAWLGLSPFAPYAPGFNAPSVAA